MPEPHMYRVEVLVESFSNDPAVIRNDVSTALSPKGFMPKVVTVSKER